MSAWRKIRRILSWFAVAMILGGTHYLIWSRGRDEAEFEHNFRMLTADLEREVEQIKAIELGSANISAYRRRVEAKFIDELTIYGRAVEADGYPSTLTMDSGQVADTVRRSKELILKLKE